MHASEEDSAKFRLEQYKSLRADVLHTRNAYFNLEKLVAGACAAIYAWLAKGGGSTISVIGWWIPVLLVGLAGLRAIAFSARLRHLDRQLDQIKAHYLGALTEPGEDPKAPIVIPLTAWIFWIVLHAVTVVVGIWH